MQQQSDAQGCVRGLASALPPLDHLIFASGQKAQPLSQTRADGIGCVPVYAAMRRQASQNQRRPAGRSHALAAEGRQGVDFHLDPSIISGIGRRAAGQLLPMQGYNAQAVRKKSRLVPIAAA